MRIACVVAEWNEMTPGKSSTLAMIREAVARGHQTYIL